MKSTLALAPGVRIGMCLAILCSGALMSTTALGALPATTGGMQLRQAIGATMAGDGKRARAILHDLDTTALSETARDASQCMISRLERRDASSGQYDVAGAVLAIYQAYWREAVLGEIPPGSAATRRRRALASLFGLDSDSDEQVVESATRNALLQAGYFVLLGTTPPFDDLVLWRTQKLLDFSVELPETNRTTRVAVMGGIVAKGWSDYLTCGLAGTGGWADSTVVFVIPDHFPAGLEDNRFVASLLAHESQHMADYADFGRMPAWRLEYRAKLAELWRSDDANVRRIIAIFGAMQSTSVDAPHPYANRLVMQALERASESGIDTATTQEIRGKSLELLHEDSRALRNAGS